MRWILGFASPKVATASRSEGNFHPKTKQIVFQGIKFNKFRRSIFRLDKAKFDLVLLNLNTTKSLTKYREMNLNIFYFASLIAKQKK